MCGEMLFRSLPGTHGRKVAVVSPTVTWVCRNQPSRGLDITLNPSALLSFQGGAYEAKLQRSGLRLFEIILPAGLREFTQLKAPKPQWILENKQMLFKIPDSKITFQHICVCCTGTHAYLFCFFLCSIKLAAGTDQT